MSYRILIVEDDQAFAKMLSSYLTRNFYEITLAHSGVEAREKLKTSSFNLIITDLQLPDDSGLSLLDYSKEINPSLKVILITGFAEVKTAVEAIKKGAFDYISKPFRPEELLMVISNALKTEPKKNTFTSKAHLIADKNSNSGSVDKNPFVSGISESSKKFNDYLKLVGPTDICVLIEGESGTGKEVAAKAIHKYSTRNSEPFIAVDCGAIPKEIAASEFFGHIKGSFTGALHDKKGHFEAAHKGTLFLDEVGNLSYENQIQLLRALQERKVKPVGSNIEIEVDVRIISATNENLQKAVAEGKFREDLFHRINEFSVKIPSLSERIEDMFLFVEFFLEEANKSLNKNVLGLSKEVQNIFKVYSWPGNLRELKNIIKRAVLLTDSEYIPLSVIPQEVLNEKISDSVQIDFTKQTNEKQLILNALTEAKNNKTKAAKLLNITRKTLYNKIEQYNIDL